MVVVGEPSPVAPVIRIGGQGSDRSQELADSRHPYAFKETPIPAPRFVERPPRRPAVACHDSAFGSAAGRDSDTRLITASCPQIRGPIRGGALVGVIRRRADRRLQIQSVRQTSWSA